MEHQIVNFKKQCKIIFNYGNIVRYLAVKRLLWNDKAVLFSSTTVLCVGNKSFHSSEQNTKVGVHHLNIFHQTSFVSLSRLLQKEQHCIKNLNNFKALHIPYLLQDHFKGGTIMMMITTQITIYENV